MFKSKSTKLTSHARELLGKTAKTPDLAGVELPLAANPREWWKLINKKPHEVLSGPAARATRLTVSAHFHFERSRVRLRDPSVAKVSLSPNLGGLLG